MKALYVTPLTSGNRRLGTMGFGSKDVSAYSKTHLSFLQQVARQVALAVDNTLNFESAKIAEQPLRRERDRLQLMLKITSAVVSQLDLRELVRVISSCLREALQPDIASVSLYDPEINQLRFGADGRRKEISQRPLLSFSDPDSAAGAALWGNNTD